MRLLISLFLIGTFSLELSTTESPESLPCNLMGRIVAGGSRAEQDQLAEQFRGIQAEVVAERCREDLLQGFASPLREFRLPGSDAALHMESAWLAALLPSLPPDDAARWGAELRVDLLAREVTDALLSSWARNTTDYAKPVFRILGAAQPADRDAQIRLLREPLLDWEGQDENGARLVEGALRDLGYGFLYDEPIVSAVWRIVPLMPDKPGGTAALQLARGELAAAWESLRTLSRNDPRFLVPLAMLADLGFQQRLWEPSQLIPFGVEFMECRDGYRVLWNLGALTQAGLTVGSPEADAEAAVRTVDPCAAVDTEVLRARHAAMAASHPGSVPELRLRLRLAENLADDAEKVLRQGRTEQALALRQEALRIVAQTDAFRYFGGTARASALRDTLQQLR